MFQEIQLPLKRCNTNCNCIRSIDAMRGFESSVLSATSRCDTENSYLLYTVTSTFENPECFYRKHFPISRPSLFWQKKKLHLTGNEVTRCNCVPVASTITVVLLDNKAITSWANRFDASTFPRNNCQPQIAISTGNRAGNYPNNSR